MNNEFYVLTSESECIKQCKQLIVSKKLDAASDLSLLGSKKYPNSFELKKLYAEILMKNKRFFDAVEAWDEFRIIFPQAFQGYTQSCLAHLALGNIDDAYSLAENALKIAPDAIDSYICFVEVLIKQKKYKLASEYLVEVKSKFPKSIKEYYLGFTVYRYLNEYKKAANICREGIKIYNNDFNLYCKLAFSLMHNKESRKSFSVIRSINKLRNGISGDIKISQLCTEWFLNLDENNPNLNKTIQSMSCFLYNNKTINIDLRLILDKKFSIFVHLEKKYLKKIFYSKIEYILIMSTIFRMKDRRKLSWKMLEYATTLTQVKEYYKVFLRVTDIVCTYYFPYNYELAAKICDLLQTSKDFNVKIAVLEYKATTLFNTRKWQELKECCDEIKEVSLKNNVSYSVVNYYSLVSRYTVALNDTKDSLYKLELLLEEAHSLCDIHKVLVLYTELAKLSGDLSGIFAKNAYNFIKHKSISSLYICMSLVNNSICEISDLDVDISYELIYSAKSILGNAKYKSINTLKLNLSEFLNNINKCFGTQEYNSLLSINEISKPYYLKSGELKGDIKKENKNIAVLFSGFVRNYNYYRVISQLKEHDSGYNIFFFYYIFDRLGNIRVDRSIPREFYSYGNGGLYKEISKTKLLNKERFEIEFKPSCYKIVRRETDQFYLDTIGISHPQWFMVYKSFKLLEGFSKDNDIHFDFVCRARIDNFPKDPYGIYKACHDIKNYSEDDILVMQRYSFGHYCLSDRFAFGTPQAIRRYCEIGNLKNFLSVEQSEFWKNKIRQPYSPTGGSHETHLGRWLEIQKINFHKKVYLDA